MIPVLASAVSGCLWAMLAYLLVGKPLGPSFIGGILASPVTGATMVVFTKYYRRTRRRPSTSQATENL